MISYYCIFFDKVYVFSTNQYNFKIDITLAEETISLESQAILSNNSFNGTSTTLINFSNDNIEISMSLEKLNNSLYSVV